MRESIVGICRFSFLGKCDWVDTRSTDGASDEVLTLRQSMLYTEARLRRRFKAFETMCLPSIRAQTDPDFSFWLLTSPELSEPWMQHLAQLCADIPQIRILVSEARLTSDALRPHLRQAARAAGHPVIQFRIDDDDALSRHHVARIRQNAPTFADQPTFAMSNPEGLIFGSLDGREVQYYRVSRGFVSAGATARMERPGLSIYARPHFGLPKHYPEITCQDGLGFVQTRWELGDTSGRTPRAWSGWQPLERGAFDELLSEDFPFLQSADLSFSETKWAI